VAQLRADLAYVFSRYANRPEFARALGKPVIFVDNANVRGRWQIVTSFNEWGEGTSVEGAREWASASGFGTYLDILHNDGGASHPGPK
jgi:hypothetical protein